MVDWFVPQRARNSKAALGRARMFVISHILGPASATSISLFLHLADPDPGWRVGVIDAGVVSFWTLPFLMKATGSLEWAARLSYEMLLALTLYGAYFYGGMSSPFLPWLLISLANGFFYLHSNPRMVLAVFVANLVTFLAIWKLGGGLPQRVPVEQLTNVGLVSAITATMYMGGLAIYYGMLLASESNIAREAQRHRQTAERLQRARENAEQANREKSLFLARMSHELRTPLNAVIGFSEILAEDAEFAGDAARVKDLARINTAGRHLLSLVNDILDISSIEANRMSLQSASFNIEAALAAIAVTARPLVETNRNKLVVNVEPQLGVMKSDELRLRQAVLNLLSNAAKFTTEGVVSLTARGFRVDGRKWFEIEIRDTGIGISPEDLKILFQEFRQVNSAASRKQKGTGLGLALSQKLCRMMGGEIFVESEPGSGSCFTIRLPAEAPAEPAQVAYKKAA
jgi:signal transduction histidine kinase